MDDIASNVGDVVAPIEIDFSLLSGANATFIAEMNRAWRDNPSSVDRHWAAYFEQLGKAADFGADTEAGPSWGRPQSRVVGAVDADEQAMFDNSVAAVKALNEVVDSL